MLYVSNFMYLSFIVLLVLVGNLMCGLCQHLFLIIVCN